MEGVAYFVVGVEPQNLVGVTPLDSAKLEDQLARYVGAGPRWTPTYVELGGVEVLVITDEAPEPGDPLHPARKTFQPAGGGSAFDAGTLFVRRGAKTVRASADDVHMLVRRAQAFEQGRALDVAVLLDDSADGLERFANGERLIAEFVERRRQGCSTKFLLGWG